MNFASSLCFVLLLNSSLFSSNILSDIQRDKLELSKQQIETNTDKLKSDIILPINYTYSYNNSDQIFNNTELGTIKKSTITINQPIFKSGGIYSSIKYVNNLKKTNQISSKIQKQALIKNAISIAYNIKKLNLQIKKQNFSLKNAILDLNNKKESVFQGVLDISFLNNAIIVKNNIQSGLLDLEFQKESLINSFSLLSSQNIENIRLPRFTHVTLNKFQNNNLLIQKNTLDINSKKYLKAIATSKYLPSVNLNYSKTFDHINDINYNSYGFKIIVPFDYGYFNGINLAKLDYIKAQNKLKILKKNEFVFFKTHNLKIKTIDAKIELTNENIKVYKELLKQTKELKNIGLKTIDDVQILENSTNSEMLNLQIYDIDQQIELLEIYVKISNNKM